MNEMKQFNDKSVKETFMIYIGSPVGSVILVYIQLLTGFVCHCNVVVNSPASSCRAGLCTSRFSRDSVVPKLGFSVILFELKMYNLCFRKFDRLHEKHR